MNDSPIRYLNTDLDLVVDINPESLVQELDEKGFSIHSQQGTDQLWYIICEDFCIDNDLNINLTHLLNGIDSLSKESQRIWDHCSKKEFNIGFDSGFEPRNIYHSIPHHILKRIVDSQATFAITIYRIPEDR